MRFSKSEKISVMTISVGLDHLITETRLTANNYTVNKVYEGAVSIGYYRCNVRHYIYWTLRDRSNQSSSVAVAHHNHCHFRNTNFRTYVNVKFYARATVILNFFQF